MASQCNETFNKHAKLYQVTFFIPTRRNRKQSFLKSSCMFLIRSLSVLLDVFDGAETVKENNRWKQTLDNEETDK